VWGAIGSSMTGSAAGRLNGVLDADFLRLIRRPSAGSGACLGRGQGGAAGTGPVDAAGRAAGLVASRPRPPAAGAVGWAGCRRRWSGDVRSAGVRAS
jgi:hypothetical protein